MKEIWPEIDTKIYWNIRRHDDAYDPLHFLRIPNHIFVKPGILKKFQKKEAKKKQKKKVKKERKKNENK